MTSSTRSSLIAVGVGAAVAGAGYYGLVALDAGRYAAATGLLGLAGAIVLVWAAVAIVDYRRTRRSRQEESDRRN